MMKMRWFVLLSVLTVLLIVFSASSAWATSMTTARQPAPTLLRRCENNYDQEEIDAMLADGEDGYEPDDCPLLAHTLTGPMLLNFCQAGDEDWVKFKAKANLIYQIRAQAPANYSTEPHLELYDDGALIAQNDHYFGNNAEIWWWNTGAERMVYIRATELGGRHACGNSEYTLSLRTFTEKP